MASEKSWRRRSILRCICHFPFVFTLLKIFRRLQVIILSTPKNVKRHTTGQQRPMFNCSLQLQLKVDSGTPRHLARSYFVHCQSDFLGTVENTVFAGQWCEVCPKGCQGQDINVWRKDSGVSLSGYNTPRRQSYPDRCVTPSSRSSTPSLPGRSSTPLRTRSTTPSRMDRSSTPFMTRSTTSSQKGRSSTSFLLP